MQPHPVFSKNMKRLLIDRLLHHSRSKTMALAVSALALGLGSSAKAQSSTWNVAGNGAWSTAGNWVNGVPTSTNDAVFNTAGLNQAETITLATGEVAQGLVFSQTGTTVLSGGTLALGSDGLTLNSGAG